MVVKKHLFLGILLIIMFVLTGCNEKVETLEQVKKEEVKIVPIAQIKEDKAVPTMNEEREKIHLKLTQAQKEEYHKQYVKIVERVNEQKLGMQLEVSSIDSFKTEEWVEPKVFEKRVHRDVVFYLKEERKALNARQTTEKQDATEVSDGWALEKYIYVAGIVSRIEVIGDFVMQYSKSRKGQVFAGINKVSTQVAKGSIGKWEQTSYKASLLNGGQTYNIRIEGIHHYNGFSIEKVFTIKFNCDKSGKIHSI